MSHIYTSMTSADTILITVLHPTTACIIYNVKFSQPGRGHVFWCECVTV